MKKNIVNHIKYLFSGFICLMLASYLGSHILLVVPAINRAHIERHKSNVKRLVSLTAQQFDYHLMNLRDNAQWDLLYEILDPPTPSREGQQILEDLFDKSSLRHYGLDYIGIYNRDKSELASTSTSKVDIENIFLSKNKKHFFSIQPNGKNRIKMAAGYIELDGRAYTFLSHIILDNAGEGKANGYLLFLKAMDTEYIFDLEIKNNLLLNLYIPQGERGERVNEKILESTRKSEYYSELLGERKRAYYAPYFENPKKLAFAIEVIVEDEISHAIMLSFFIGILPILILVLMMVFIKDTVDKKLVDPIMALHKHIEAVKDEKAYKLLKHPKVGNEVDEVIGAFNNLMVEVSFQRDEIESKNAILENLAYVDHLTGLSTRRVLDEEYELLFQRAMEKNDTLTLIMIDVDYFKRYNDYYGHLKGDTILKSVGRILTDVFRNRADLISRYGGEEFLLILYDISLTKAISLVERFQEELTCRNIEHSASPLGKVTTSIGINSGRISGDMNSTAFLEKADRLLYRAKEEGRNRFSY
ncbi:hypothetical protein PM10SUCC1_01690 [Propionigenium maris DSM 9537]|uniref:GGDEF domain-containing protein n=1 Tax=Propionigenium maris DSM 9537 TaxID=1123000 RepID=A0A9W6GG57_9FUSO|nr:diguanylate cyclase [Propionigenium maris]GLI54654.1 hypothetical protein PM10SUCC1_01690 [Propionigenium maris DSM 9537]